MEFPERELEIIQLAQDMSTGLAALQAEFPNPPASPEEINAALAAYTSARESAKAANASASKSRAQKEEALKTVVELVRLNIKYAEGMARRDESKLQALGWGARRNRTFADDAPGQVITLQVTEEGKSWVKLEWKQPFDGGAVLAYRVQRRRPGGEWIDVGTSVETGLTLNGQESGVEFEYQVLALNKFGAGPASNIVRVVL